MACWLTTLCLLSSFACIWSGVIHTDSDLEVGHGITLDNIVDSTNDGLVNFSQENVTLRISAETNVSSTSLESEIHRNVSENVTVNENIHVISNETEDSSSSSGHSDTVNKLIVSVKNETLIDVNSTGSVSIASESTRDNTTQTSTEIKSTEKFSSQIPSDSPTPTLSSVTNSSLVVKESVTDAEQVNSTTASSNIDVNDTILQTVQPSDTDVQTTVSSNNLLITKAQENGVVLDVILDNFTTTNSAATDISSSSFIQPSADSGHVQDLRMLSNSTDGFDLIMDSTIDSSVDIGTVKMEVNSTDPSKITNDIVTVTNVLDTVSIDAASLNSGTSGTPQTSTDSGITPVSSPTGQFKGNSPGITETVTFETARRTTLSTAIPSISVETENNSVGSSLSTAMESVSETTTSMDKVINPQIQITEQVTLPAVTASTTTSNSLQATNKPTALITDSTPETTNKPTISVTDSTPEISTDSVLPPIHIKLVSTETDDQTSTQNQIESTKNSDKTTMVNVETTSEVPGTNSNLRATTVISQQLKTTNKMQEPLESTTVSSGSSLLSTIETGVSSIDIENSTISSSEAASLIVESTAKAGVTGETTEENTIQMTVQLPGINTETTKPVTGTNRMTTAQSTTDNKVELTRAMTTSRVTTKVETTVPMTTDPVTTTTTSTTTPAPSTTIVSTTPRPCPEYQSKYNRNDLIVSTDPEGCVMIAKIVDLRGRFRGPNRMIWRKMHAGLRGLRYPSVSFTYKGSKDAEDKCQMPVKSVGPYIVVDTIPGRCQMVVGLRSVRAPVDTPGKKGQQQRRFRFRLVMRPVLEYLEGTLL